MADPIRILVERDELALEGIKQFFVAVERAEWKFDTWCDLYDMLAITWAVIFCNTARKVSEGPVSEKEDVKLTVACILGWLVGWKMKEANFTVFAMDGGLP